MKIPVKVGDKRGRGEVANSGYDKKNMSTTWKVIMYSSIGLVSAAAVYVGGFIHGSHVGAHEVNVRHSKEQARKNAERETQTSDVAQA